MAPLEDGLTTLAVSPSERYGSGGQQKVELAAEFSAVIAFSAIRSGDKIGTIFFTDRVEKYISPNSSNPKAGEFPLIVWRPRWMFIQRSSALPATWRATPSRRCARSCTPFTGDQF